MYYLIILSSYILESISSQNGNKIAYNNSKDISRVKNQQEKKMRHLLRREMTFHLQLMRIRFHLLKLLISRGVTLWVVKFSKH
jgi:hypothetical protein